MKQLFKFFMPLILLLSLACSELSAQNCELFSFTSVFRSDNGDGTCNYDLTLDFNISNCNNNSGSLVITIEDEAGATLLSDTFTDFCSGLLTFPITTPCNATVIMTEMLYDGPGGSDCPVIVVPQSISLPVDLINFDLSRTADEILFDWSTGTEYNSDYFELEHSTDGLSFRTVRKIMAQGFADDRTAYSSTLPISFSGVQYFRLKMVDVDGGFSLSPVLTIVVPSRNDFVSTYDSQSGVLKLEFSERTTFVQDLVLVDALGRIVSRSAIPRNTANFQLAIPQMSMGLYYVSIAGAETQRVFASY